MDLTRKELLLMTGRADAYSDELFDTKRKLGQTVEAKAFLQDEISAAEQRLAESRNQVIIIIFPTIFAFILTRFYIANVI